jgi:hypothetical protein
VFMFAVTQSSAIPLRREAPPSIEVVLAAAACDPELVRGSAALMWGGVAHVFLAVALSGVGPEYERNVPHASGRVGHRRESVS